MSQFWRLDGPLQTLILAAQQERLPQVIYWGPPLPASDDCASARRRPCNGCHGRYARCEPRAVHLPRIQPILSRSTGSHVPRCAGARAAPRSFAL